MQGFITCKDAREPCLLRERGYHITMYYALRYITMRIIIEVKDTATLSRIEELGNALHAVLQDYGDVIASIDKEF